MKNVVKNKLKRVSLEEISTYLNSEYKESLDVSLVDYSIKDFSKNKTVLKTKHGLKENLTKKYKDDILLNIMVDKLKILLGE